MIADPFTKSLPRTQTSSFLKTSVYFSRLYLRSASREGVCWKSVSLHRASGISITCSAFGSANVTALTTVVLSVC